MNKGSTITTEKSFFLRRDINPWKGKYPVQVFVLGNIFIIFLSLRTKNLTSLSMNFIYEIWPCAFLKNRPERPRDDSGI